MSDPAEASTSERVFIHDISTPIAVALGMIDLVMDDLLSGAQAVNETQKKRLEKAQNALLKLQGMLTERRKSILNSVEASSD